MPYKKKVVQNTEERIAFILNALKDLDEKQAMLIESNPFMYFEPSTGEIPDTGKVVLSKWLKPDDVPVKLDGQVEAFRSDADVILTAGGNQSGKTTFLVIYVLICVTGMIPFKMKDLFPKSKLPVKFPIHARVVGVDHKTFLANLLPAFQHWVPRECLKNGKWSDSWSAERNTLFLYSSVKADKLLGTVEFMTNQQDVESFQGPPRHLIAYDEEPRYDIYRENLMRFTTADRLNIVFAMTPTKGLSWVKDEILDRYETQDGSKIDCFKLVSVTNKKANMAVLDEILKGLSSYEEIRMRLLGEFVSLSGLVYGKLFSRKAHLIEPFDVRGDDYLVYRGLDPHLVKPSVCVELAVDRESNKYVVGCYAKDEDTSIIKKDLADRAKERGYRLGQARCDKSANSTIKALGDRNIFRELSTGENAVPAMVTSEKFTGSINAGVDAIKQDLRLDEHTGKPKLFFFNIPENRMLIKAMETMERELATNEDKKGIRDKIAEGQWDLHAALRYIYQGPIRWFPPQTSAPTLPEERYV